MDTLLYCCYVPFLLILFLFLLPLSPLMVAFIVMITPAVLALGIPAVIIILGIEIASEGTNYGFALIAGGILIYIIEYFTIFKK